MMRRERYEMGMLKHMKCMKYVYLKPSHPIICKFGSTASQTNSLAFPYTFKVLEVNSVFSINIKICL